MVFGAIRAGRGVKAEWGVARLKSLAVDKPTLVIAAAAVLTIMAIALVAFVSVGS